MPPHIDPIHPAMPWAALSALPGEPRLNALKHGRRAATILLPGEDAAEFNELLQEVFADHRPRTRREIRCVEAIADYEWCLERNGRMRRYYHAQVAALHAGDRIQPHCDHDPHRWHHSAQDCTREEARLMRLRRAALEELETLKQLRRQNLLTDAMQALEGPTPRPPFLAAAPVAPTATPAGPVSPPEGSHAEPAPSIGPAVAVDASSDGRKAISPERASWEACPAAPPTVRRDELPDAPPAFPWQTPSGGMLDGKAMAR